MYGCEIWAESSSQKLETFQLYVGKQILHCHAKACNDGILSELGWLSMKSQFDMRRLLFWYKLTHKSSDRIIHKLYVYSKRHISINEKHKTWCEYTFKLLCQYNLQNYWWNESLLPSSLAAWKKLVHSHIFTYEINNRLINISCNTKLSMYVLGKNDFSCSEHYLDYVGKHYLVGLYELVKLRISCHNLRIETGRYDNTERNKRICLCCDLNVIENELHYICECKLYSEQRLSFYTKINDELHVNLYHYTQFDQYYELIGLRLYKRFNYVIVLEWILQYLSAIKDIRSNCLNQHAQISNNVASTLL